jgi:hypothetical protein
MVSGEGQCPCKSAITHYLNVIKRTYNQGEINPTIRARTRHSCHAYHPTRDNIILLQLISSTNSGHKIQIFPAYLYKYYVSGPYPSSCLCLRRLPVYLSKQRFGDWILSPSSGKTYSVRSSR